MMKIKERRWLWFMAAFVVLIGLSGSALAGDLEPGAAPAPTMKTLDEISPTWSQILPAADRFELVMGGAAVLDKETGLTWEAYPNADVFTSNIKWGPAIAYCYQKTVGNRKGWRLPTLEELASLVDPSQALPALPNGAATFFNNTVVEPPYYWHWSATTTAGAPDGAWRVVFSSGDVGASNKFNPSKAWCVRGGHGYDAY